MARSDSSGTAQFVTIAVFVVIGSVGLGYYFAGGMQRSTDRQPVQSSKASTSAPATSTTANASTAQPAASTDSTSADYTAPNSPKIEIQEEKAPAPPATKAPSNRQVASNTPDSEASQEDSTMSTDDTTDTGTVGSVPSPVTGNATAPSDSSQSTDPDYEQSTGGSDSESSQEGASTDAAIRPRYRVQVGTFTQAMSARSLADALRNRGYTTTTVTDNDGDKTVYHVQTGAYRSRGAADRATLDLQRDGFPAFVTPISN